MDISRSGCQPDPILLGRAASQTQYRWVWLPNSQIQHLLEAIWVGSGCQARPTSFWHRKDNVPQLHFLTTKQQRQRLHSTTVFHNANTLRLQCGPQSKKSISTINTQCFSHVCQARPNTCWNRLESGLAAKLNTVESGCQPAFGTENRKGYVSNNTF